MKMPKRFQFEVVETGVRATVELLEDDAPRTCAALWRMLKTPIETNGVHAMWSGREVMSYIPPENRGSVDPTSIGLENGTCHPAPGDVVWAYFPSGTIKGFKDDGWDLAFIHGPDTRIYIPTGMVPTNVCGKIVEGLEGFADEVSLIRFGNRKTLRLTRLD
jgi:hypothetical protein